MQIQDHEDDLIFTYKLQSGAAEKSYGVRVAKMAGLPNSIIDSAERWLEGFEKKKESGDILQLSLF